MREPPTGYEVREGFYQGQYFVRTRGTRHLVAQVEENPLYIDDTLPEYDVIWLDAKRHCGLAANVTRAVDRYRNRRGRWHHALWQEAKLHFFGSWD